MASTTLPLPVTHPRVTVAYIIIISGTFSSPFSYSVSLMDDLLTISHASRRLSRLVANMLINKDVQLSHTVQAVTSVINAMVSPPIGGFEVHQCCYLVGFE